MSAATSELAGAPDQEARARIAEDFAATFFVEASAGTGKTTALIGRLVNLLASDATTLERVVAVTFTEKAAGELKLRLREALEEARAAATEPEVHDRLLAAAVSLEVARIQTIHAFCADLLRLYPVEAELDPSFEVASGSEATRLFAEAFEGWFQEALADPPPGVRRVLSQRPRGYNPLGARDRLLRAAWQLAEHRDLSAPWPRPVFDREAALDRAVAALRSVEPYDGQSTYPRDYLAKAVAKIAAFTRHLALREETHGERDHDALEDELRTLRSDKYANWDKKGRGRWFSRTEEIENDEVRAVRDGACAALDEALAQCEVDLASRLQEELTGVVERYEALKARRGRLDFLDLLLRARRLVRDHRDTRIALQAQLSHFFVDEFQDTDPVQAELLVLLAADDPAETEWTRVTPKAGKLFFVGDPKQAIYRFRRADLRTYDRVKDLLTSRGAEVLRLETSFRATPAIQAAVNATFAAAMPGKEPESEQADYAPLAPHRSEATGQPSVVALPVPRPYDPTRSGYWAGRLSWECIQVSYPAAVAGWLAWLVRDSGWTVEERGRRVPVAARHVCLLFRRFRRFGDDATEAYVRGLEAHGLRHVLVGGRTLHERAEVLAVRNALTAIEWPTDELRVFATLRGPLFALADRALMGYRHRFKRLDPLRAGRAREDLAETGDALDDADRAELSAVASGLEILGDLHRRRARRPIAETLQRLLEAVRAHAGLALGRGGEQALANVLRLVERARSFERDGAASFRAFCERLEDEAERGEAEEAPAFEEGTDGIRIMTVHRAKGLEFPVVILCDPTCRSTRRPSRHLDAGTGVYAEALCGANPQPLLDNLELEGRRDREEATRLAYVAATRARDILVAPVTGDGPIPGWLDPLTPAFLPKSPDQPDAPPGCPPFGVRTVLDRPIAVQQRALDELQPGWHAPQLGEHRVCVWDPALLPEAPAARAAIPSQHLLAPDGPAEVEALEAAGYAAWRIARSETIERASRRTLRAERITSRAAEPGGRDDGRLGESLERVRVVHVPRAPAADRPTGRRFGTLVHAVLSVIPLDAPTQAIRERCAVRGRLLGATELEVDHAVEVVGSTLGHPLLQGAREATRTWREVPFTLPVDGDLVEGVIDLAYEAPSPADPGVRELTVIDYKTDRDLSAALDTYRAQVAWYVFGLERALGLAARGVLLVV